MQLVLNDGDAALGADQVQADNFLIARLEGSNGVTERWLGADSKSAGLVAER